MNRGSELLERLLQNADLSEAEAAELLRDMASAAIAPPLAAGLLIALRAKGEAVEEIRGLASAMRELALQPSIGGATRAVDIVGTGGDRSGSLNLSTGAALLTAACGLPVIKHGNRSVSSKSGSADVLEALGLPMPLDQVQAGRCFEALGFTFLFAPFYHAATKNIAAVRGALGVRTVFNILGPLANPAAPPFAVVGAYSEEMAAIMAQTLSGMPLERAFVVHGAPGWDEATPVGPFVCFDVGQGRVVRELRDPLDYGLERCEPAALRGGSAAENAARLKAALAGADTSAHRDALALGAGLALEVAGESVDLAAGIARAREAIASGAARALLEKLAAFQG